MLGDKRDPGPTEAMETRERPCCKGGGEKVPSGRDEDDDEDSWGAVEASEPGGATRWTEALVGVEVREERDEANESEAPEIITPVPTNPLTRERVAEIELSESLPISAS